MDTAPIGAATDVTTSDGLQSANAGAPNDGFVNCGRTSIATRAGWGFCNTNVGFTLTALNTGVPAARRFANETSSKYQPAVPPHVPGQHCGYAATKRTLIVRPAKAASDTTFGVNSPSLPVLVCVHTGTHVAPPSVDTSTRASRLSNSSRSLLNVI